MHFGAHTPGPELSPFIESLWSLSDAPAHARERIFPSGNIELVINLAEDDFTIYRASSKSEAPRRLPGAMVSGCYSAPFDFDTRAHASVMGVHFRPGGAAAFLGVPPGELADEHVALEDLWGPSASELRERLCEAQSLRSKRWILEDALRARLAHGRSPRAAVVHALHELERPGMDVGRVTREVGLSRRRLIEIFTQDVGMTPKRFSRARRFQRALASAAATASPHWGKLALEHGYFDQAHLYREWAELSGLTPSQLTALRSIAVKDNHLALPDQGSNLSKTSR